MNCRLSRPSGRRQKQARDPVRRLARQGERGGDLSLRLGPEAAEKAGEFIPMGRIGQPEDIADVALFLASNAARYMTGQVVVVDGGLLVGRY